MEGEVATHTGMDNGIMLFLFCFIGRIHSLHTEIETHNKIIEIQTEAQTIAYGQVA
jgi:hypothetical protein